MATNDRFCHHDNPKGLCPCCQASERAIKASVDKLMEKLNPYFKQLTKELRDAQRKG